MDLGLLDRRKSARSIAQEVERIKSRPIELSVIENAKSILESQLKYLASLQEVATPEEACELDVHLEHLRARVTKIDAELAARADEEKVEPGPGVRSEVPGAEPSATMLQSGAINYVLLFKQFLEQRKQNGESKTALLTAWLKENRGLSRTQVTDYLAGRTDARVSPSKCKAIEAAILASAAELGLTTRTSSD